MPLIRKKTSKRQSLSLKYKIKHKAKESKKKATKFAKKNPGYAGTRRGIKDPGIPNSWPFKDELLGKIENDRAEEEEQRIQQKEKRKAVLDKKRANGGAAPSKPAIKSVGPAPGTSRRRWWWREMKQLTEAADVFVEVLDVRDPLGTRVPDIELMIEEFNKEATQGAPDSKGNEAASAAKAAGVAGEFKFDFSPNGLAQGGVFGGSSTSTSSLFPALSGGSVAKKTVKPIIYILNKIDMVPPVAVKKWLDYFNAVAPTFAFKSTQPRVVDKHSTKKVVQELDAKDPVEASIGAEQLFTVLRSIAKPVGSKMIRAVFIGAPNTGKSSVINSICKLRKVKAATTITDPITGDTRPAPVALGGGRCGVSMEPGTTQLFESVRVEADLELVDTPAPVLNTATTDPNILILRNFAAMDKSQDHSAVEALLKLLPKPALMAFYKIADFDDVNEFLAQVAAKQGKLLKGGRPDIKFAHRAVLRDWNHGRIPWFCTYPDGRTLAQLGLPVLPAPIMTTGADLPALLHAASDVAATEQARLFPATQSLDCATLPANAPLRTGADDEPEQEEAAEAPSDNEDAEDDDESKTAATSTGFSFVGGAGFSFGGDATPSAAPVEEKKAVTKKKATSKGAAAAVAKKEAKKAKAASKKGSGPGKAVKEVTMSTDGSNKSDEIEPVTLNAPPAKHNHTKQSYSGKTKQKKPAAAASSSSDAYDFGVLDTTE